jgi:hypothetical protein
MTYRHTLIKPAFCPFHLVDTRLTASERMKAWDRDADALRHVKDEHLKDAHWPLACPLGCEEESKDEQSFCYHLGDCHGYSLPSGAQKRKRQDGDVGQVKKQKLEGEHPTNCKPAPLGELFVKTERGADPTLPIVIDSDDSTEPLAIVKAAPTQAYADLYPSPEETPPFSRGMSLCSTIDEDLERPGAYGHDRINPELADQDDYFMSDWVSLPPSPGPDNDVESLDSACSIADRIKSPPPPAVSSKDERQAPVLSLNAALETTESSVPNANDAGGDPASNDGKKPTVPLIRLNYKRPKIVLRLNQTPGRGRQAGEQPGRPNKRRRKA